MHREEAAATRSRVSGWIVFLDVDGVLLPVPKFSFGGGELDKSCVERLEKIIAFLRDSPESRGMSNGDDTQDENRDVGPSASGVSDAPLCPVTLILSSTWRNYPEMIARLNAFFQRHSQPLARLAALRHGSHIEVAEGEEDTARIVPPIAGGTPNGTVLVSTVHYYADQPSEQRLVRDRVDEIYAWLHEHVEDYPEGIAGRWFAIDDMKLDVDERMEGHFLHTLTETGLRDEDVDRAIALVKTRLPSPTVAWERAETARRDPALFQEKLLIQQVLQQRLQAEVEALKAREVEREAKIHQLSEDLRQAQKQESEWKRRHEEVSQRLAVLEFAKRNSLLQAALDFAAQKTGKERKEVDAKIAALVQLMRQKKELEKRIRSEKKKEMKQRHTAPPAAALE